jgi:hypothetical protein
MIQDVIRDVKNKKKVFLLLYLIRGNARILLGFYLLHTIKRSSSCKAKQIIRGTKETASAKSA